MLNDLSAILSSALQDEATFVAAHLLYSESFRDAESFRLSDEPSMREELISYLRSDVYASESEVIKKGLSLEVAEAIVGELDFVWTCNYKGEGGDFELLERVKHLRVYHGKHNYS